MHKQSCELKCDSKRSYPRVVYILFASLFLTYNCRAANRSSVHPLDSRHSSVRARFTCLTSLWCAWCSIVWIILRENAVIYVSAISNSTSNDSNTKHKGKYYFLLKQYVQSVIFLFLCKKVYNIASSCIYFWKIATATRKTRKGWIARSLFLLLIRRSFFWFAILSFKIIWNYKFFMNFNEILNEATL